MDEMEDDMLVSLACGGNAKAFEALVERHYERIYAIAFKWCRSKDAAQDIAQECCIKMAGGLGTYRRGSKFTTWLYTLVLNTARDWQRRQGRQSLRETPLAEGYEGVSPDAGAEDKLFARQALEEIYALPDKERDAVLLVFAEGLSHREAAKILGCAEPTVSWRIHRARARLNKRLAGKEGWNHG